MDGICNYDYTIKTGTFDIGSGRKMRLSSVLKYQEQAGEEHLSHAFGLNYITLSQKGVAFVLVNSGVKIHRMPTLGESLTINTWNKQLKGMKFFRGYDWFDEKGEKIIEGVSAFVLVSINGHKIVKPSELGMNFPEEKERENSVGLPSKTHIPKEMTAVGSKKVFYSMLDSNEHLNNALYADLIVDFIPPQKVKDIKGFTLDYVKEAKLGDRIEVFSAEDNGKTYLQGINDNNCCFRASIEY